ncbi:MAG: hypothetical protein H6733_17915 [Alphaproteobacteria bacterium]|nr:hypothetical protein [Alphaproteobacteria bacterium]
MTKPMYDLFVDMKAFLKWTPADESNLVALADIVERHGPGISDAFYASLQAYPPTAAIVEGRVDALKATHLRWMRDLTQGDYSEAFYDGQFRIGEVHVAVGIDPAYVEAVMSVLRFQFRAALYTEFDPARAGELFDSLCKVLDLSLMVINLSYQDERIARISGFTGMGRKLIENLVKKGKRA